MSVDIETIGVAVDSSGVVKGTKALNEFGKSADSASRKADELTKIYDRQGRVITDSSIRQAKAHADNERALRSNQTAVSGLSSGLKGLAAAYVSLQSAAALVRTIDEYTKFNAQLKLATRSQSEYAQALSDVQRISTVAQASLGGIGVLYARINNAVRDLGVSQAEVAKITENVGLALKVSGATAQESASAMLQLSQAFGAGVLRGEEFNAVNEAAPALMRALAESMGVPIGRLRELASEGQITGDVLIKAFGDEKLLEKFREQAKEVQTIAGAWQTLKNEVLLSVGAINEATGASNLFIKSMTAMSNFIGKGSPFQLFGFAARSTQNRFNQALGTAGSGRGGNGNQVPGMAAVTGGNFSPNFSATVEVQDINKIHQMQEESARKAKEAHDKYLRNVEDKKRKENQFIDYKNRLEEELKRKEQELDIATYKTVAKLEKEEYERKQKYMEVLQKQANANFDEAQAKVKELEQEAKRASDEIGRSLTDALLRGFERGKSFAENFKDTLINVFKTLVLQPIIRFLVDSSGITKVLGALGSVFSGSAAAGGGSSGGFGDLGSILSSVKNIFTNGLESANIGFEQSIQEFGTFITKFGSFGESIGGAISQYSGAISNVLPYAGAFVKLLQGDFKGAAITATTTAIGSIFGPVGAGIGAVVGSLLGGMFGGGLPPRVTQSRTGIFSNGQFSSYEATDSGRRKLGMSEPLDRLNETFARNLSTIFSAFGLESEISSNSLLTKKKNTRARFNATVNGEFLGQSELDFGKKGTFEQAFASLVERALGSYTVKAIQASDLPDGIKQFFDGLVKSEDVTETINTLVGMKNALLDLPPVFNAVRNAMNTDAYKTTLDQLKAQFQATQTFVDLFYSSTEKFDIFTNQLITQFDALNKTVPTSRDQYRALVESINVVDEATRDQFNGLIALAPAMNEYFNLLSQQADGINEVNQALADGLNQNLFSTFADYASARASVANGITATGFMGDLSVRRSQGDAELVSAVKSLVAQQARTDQILAEIAKSTRETAELNKTWNGDGLPETRVY